MTVGPGARLGPYEIQSAIGAGGMGEVYRARDTRLKRDVALKILPESFASDPDRLARFQREAEVLASLSHPNIAGLYGLEESDGIRALVMELVEGETLADRIARGPIPIDETLPIAKQIAEALEAAHEQGIIHRDLKPANIKLRPDGTVKVLDFGLAKLADTSGSSTIDVSLSPTIASPAMMTGVGMLLGTATYMSPEQARGKVADKRSDIWAFGCVLFEMLCGVAAFPGEDVTDVLAAIVRADPDWNRLPVAIPPGVRNLLRRCLQKDRTLRLQSIGDARVEIHEALAAPATEPATRWTGERPLARRAAVLLGLSCLLIGGLVVGVTGWMLTPPSGKSVSRVVVPLPSGARLPALNTPVLALSPDGSKVAFIGAGNGGQQIYLRAFDNEEAKAIPDANGASSLTFSPDGKWLAFTAGGNLMRVSADGGAAVLICSAPDVEGISWGENDTIVFAATYGTRGLSKVLAGGGKPQALTSTVKGAQSAEEAHRWPQVLPGGKAVLFTAWSRNLEDAQIVVQRLDSDERRVILRGGTFARYVPTGHLVYVRGAGTLMAVPFDLARLEVAGDPFPLAEGVLLTTEGAAQFDISRNGSLVHIPGGLQGSGRRLVWVDRAGREALLESPTRAFLNPRISPDGQHIVVVVQAANDDLWTYDIPHQTLSRLTFDSRSISPVWTADGKRVIYRSARRGTLNLFAKATDPNGPEERLTASEANQAPTGASSDGGTLAFVERSTSTDIWVLPLVKDGKPRPFRQTTFEEGGAVFSPDNHWLAYHSDESGRSEVYVQPFADSGQKVQISRDGGIEPRWTTSGELFWRNGAKIMAAKVSTEPELTVDQPRVVLDGQQYATAPGTFDVSSDGKRLLMIKETELAASVTQINVVLNWDQELTRLVPTK